MTVARHPLVSNGRAEASLPLRLGLPWRRGCVLLVPSVETLEQIKARIEAAIPGAQVVDLDARNIERRRQQVLRSVRESICPFSS